MKKGFIFFLVMLALGLFTSSWAQFPCDPADSAASCCGADSGDGGYSRDLGVCDTLHVLPWPKPDTCLDGNCINDPGESFPCFVYLNLLVTHDSNTFWWKQGSQWRQDSLVGFVNPLAYTRTNLSAYCSISGYWNESAMNPYDPRFPRSLWRHFQTSELDSNRMAWLFGQFQSLEWTNIVTDFASDSSWYYYQDDSVFTPPHMWLTVLRSASARAWWEGDRTLLLTFTFRVEDSMTICVDSTWWPPTSKLSVTRYDANVYVPRHNLPICFRVHDDTVEVISGEPPEEPEIAVNPLTVDFDSVEVGDSSDTMITITNTGDADLVIYSIGVATGVYELEGTSIAPIAPDDSDSFKVIFVPSGNGLLKTGIAASETTLFEDTIRISSNAVAGDSVVSLGGVGIPSTGVRWIEDSAEGEGIPTTFSISQNYPNPFNPATEFKFDLPRDCHVKIEIFNILGQKVKTLADEEMRAGSYVADWDGKDHRGVELSSGIYFYQMWTEDFSDIKKMVLLR